MSAPPAKRIAVTLSGSAPSAPARPADSRALPSSSRSFQSSQHTASVSFSASSSRPAAAPLVSFNQPSRAAPVLLPTGNSTSSAPSPAATTPAPSQAPRFTVYASTRQAKTCPYCGPARNGAQTIVFDSSSGDQLCRECGLIVEEKVLSEEQEWRNFSAEAASSSRGGADRNRVGDALDAWLEDGGIGTTMLVASSGGPLAGKAAWSAKRLQQLHEAATSGLGSGVGSGDRQLKVAFNYIRLIGEAFALRDNVLERAKEITKDLMQDGVQLRTRSNTTTMLAITYLACREAGVTRTVKELVVYDRAISEKELGKAINRIKKLLPQRGGVNSAESATQLLPRYCSRLQLSMHVADVAEHVAKRATQVIISSHRPNSVAAAAIWLVVKLLNSSTNPNLPKASEIASVTGAGEHTLRSIYKDMLDVAEHLLPREFQPTVEGGLDGLRARYSSRKRKAGEIPP
ncbi:transcription initiation factor IIB [Toxoplasma gondii TgCatPRC2]|uniref:General transcription factor TFIIB n=13 Tax=Toxoplasma gondii TaxID=5811 RepID=A0A125YL75_TOXGV|nr:transcription initiation factor IIB [Toxoplasma gondii ME49]EPR59690.1 transcription initiation factor IIB [Toxoplasma gondii GT1]ESS33986.1 transcription initiation factor IIB [Toxoplasma gondii VEG]KAF4644593.1 transcription initiation factor IIB [Toxoplasma gondii]KFG41698.1 transcription initiation factor IIB [Toxoplasma gondii FOU]KFG42163.1 transcription initiation factor IIB [Toxoplasma gondii GAB2-2007-GAL-DOM2]KFG62903.1 transcription initiation factor IIB [Toxoplasma gondii RUB]|eukprot:XP_018636479.1 transcription initiation factor IIB [Toxoplasma gondii ME49]